MNFIQCSLNRIDFYVRFSELNWPSKPVRFPQEIIKNVARESVKQKENTRFYLQTKDEVYCSSVAIFVGNLPPNLSQRQYEKILTDLLKKRKWFAQIVGWSEGSQIWNQNLKLKSHNSIGIILTKITLPSTAYKFKQCGPIYYEYGSLIITYDNADIAVKAFYMLRESSYDDKNLLVLLLPNISPNMIPTGVRVGLKLEILGKFYWIRSGLYQLWPLYWSQIFFSENSRFWCLWT